ncbi:MAG: flagellar biosynthesis anti-sigma factor FlgM [Gammaproteobacteria bacterium]
MTIDPINGRPHNTATTKPGLQSGVSADKASATTSKAQGDSIDITSNSARINKALESAPATPIVDKERVAAIKQALADGTYAIDADKTAQKISQLDSLFKGDST